MRVDRAVGMDIVRCGPLREWEMIAAQVLSCTERALLARTPEEEQGTSFSRHWSRKEAYVKAVGHGLSIPLTDVSVELDSIETPVGDKRMY